MTEFKLDEESRRNQAFPTSKKNKKKKIKISTLFYKHWNQCLIWKVFIQGEKLFYVEMIIVHLPDS